MKQQTISNNMLQNNFNTARELTLNEEYDKAITAYEHILIEHPEHVPSHYNLGLLASRLQKSELAQYHFEQVIRLVPDFAAGYFQLAQVLLFIYKPLDAIQQLQTALRLEPEYIDAKHLLACTLMQQGQYEEATQHFEALLKLAPHHAPAHLNFALLKLHQRDLEAAKTLLETAIELDPTLIEAHYHRGVIAMQQGEIEAAIIQMLETLDRDPNHFAANYNIAILYKMQQHFQLAIHYLKRAQSLDSENESIQFLMQAFTKEKAARAPKSFVQELFDHYANTYDEHMLQTLHYQTPQQLRDLLNPYLHLLPKNPKILDLGCGTGLVGQYFEDLKAQIIGVDLSKEMLKIAEQKNIYQELIEADILDYLESTQEQFDLIIASDVFNYFGDLEKILIVCKRVLTPNGLLLFSIELSQKQDYTLHHDARFAHSKDYIEKVSVNFNLLCEKQEALRYQAHQSVMGQVFLFQKT